MSTITEVSIIERLEKVRANLGEGHWVVFWGTHLERVTGQTYEELRTETIATTEQYDDHEAELNGLADLASMVPELLELLRNQKASIK